MAFISYDSQIQRLIKFPFFWDYSGIGILGIDGICVLLGAIPFSESTEYHSVHSALDRRMNRMEGIRFTRKKTEYAFFWEIFGGKSYAAASTQVRAQT